MIVACGNPTIFSYALFYVNNTPIQEKIGDGLGQGLGLRKFSIFYKGTLTRSKLLKEFNHYAIKESFELLSTKESIFIAANEGLKVKKILEPFSSIVVFPEFKYKVGDNWYTYSDFYARWGLKFSDYRLKIPENMHELFMILNEN